MPTLGDPKEIRFATAGKQDGQVLDVACMVAGGPHAPEHASVALDALVETNLGAGNAQTREARLGVPFQDHKTKNQLTLRELLFPVPDFDANADKSVVEKVCLRRGALDMDKSCIPGASKPAVRTRAIGQDTGSDGLPCFTGLAPGRDCDNNDTGLLSDDAADEALQLLTGVTEGGLGLGQGGIDEGRWGCGSGEHNLQP